MTQQFRLTQRLIQPFKIATMLAAITVTPLSLLVTTRTAHASITNTRADSWGYQEVAQGGWLGGTGVPIYSNGSTAGGPSPDTYNCIAVSGAPGDGHCSAGHVTSGVEWQCVELVNRQYLTNGWIKSNWSGNGTDLYGDAPSNLTKEAQGSITSISQGDVIGFSGGPSPYLGHVSIVDSISGSVIQMASQNTPAVYDDTVRLSNGTLTISGWSTYQIEGVVHHPGTHKDLAWYDGTNLYGFKAYGYGTSSTQTYSAPGWAGSGRYGSDSKEGTFWYDANNTSIDYINSSWTSQVVRGPGIGAPVWAGVGDFTGDGKRDSIAWYDGTNLYLFTGSGLSTSATISGYSAPYWAGAGRRQGDSYDSLFWYLNNDVGGTTGTIYTLTSTGSTFNGAVSRRGPGIGLPTWAGVGDFQGIGYRNALAWYSGSTLYTFEGSSLGSSGSVTGYSAPTWAGVGQWDNSTIKDGLFWYIGGSDGSIYGIDSDGSKFINSTRLRGPGISAPTWAGSGNIY